MSSLDKIPPHPPPSRPETARDALLAAARKLFAEKGFDGVSVKEVAHATGHNPALINYHFSGKEGLYRECVMPFIGRGIANMQTLLQVPTSRQDFITRFTLFVEDLVATHVRDQDLCLILKRDSNTQVVKRIYKEHFVRAFKTSYSFLKVARKMGIVRRDLDPEIATHIIFGSVFDLIALERFRLDAGEECFLDDKHRPSTVRKLTEFMLAGMLIEPVYES